MARTINNPLNAFSGYHLRRASSACMAELAHELEPMSLRPAQASVLLLIDANPDVRQGAVGRLLGIASANMTPLVSRLEERALLRRHRIDGRSHGLRLSKAGHALAARVKKAVLAHEQSILKRVPAAQHTAFLAALKSLGEDEG